MYKWKYVSMKKKRNIPGMNIVYVMFRESFVYLFHYIQEMLK